MIVSADGELLFSYCPWLDRQRVAVWDAIDMRPVRTRRAGHLMGREFNQALGPGTDDFLWVISRTSRLNSTPCLSVHRRSTALEQVFRLPFTLGEQSGVEVPSEVLGTEERYWVGRYGRRWQTFILTPEDGVAASYTCSWRGRDPRDKKLPGFSGVFAVPSKAELWYAVDRTDHLIVVDSRTMQDIGTVRLSRHGCRQVLFHPNGTAIVQNFDTAVIVDLDSREVVHETRLQGAGWDDAGRKFAAFFGEMLLLPDLERLCVARPFSGDVLLVDVETLNQKGAILTEGEPLELALHPNGKDLFVRDGFTGEFSRWPID